MKFGIQQAGLDLQVSALRIAPAGRYRRYSHSIMLVEVVFYILTLIMRGPRILFPFAFSVCHCPILAMSPLTSQNNDNANLDSRWCQSTKNLSPAASFYPILSRYGLCAS